MKEISTVALLLIAAQHLGFLILEMFFWTKPLGLKIFRQPLEQAKASAALAANQGLYNGFLAAGLVWAAAHPAAEFSLQLKIFFLSCVILAGIFGGWSVNKRIFFIQALPATAALALSLF